MDTSKITPDNCSLYEELSPWQLVRIALLCEGVLFLFYLFFSMILGTMQSPGLPFLSEIVFGLLLAVLLFCCNLVLIRLSYRYSWNWVTDFMDEMILPLVSRLEVTHALLVSLAAGIGEEFFFRGLLQPYIGILLTSLLFSLAHFAFELRRFYKLSIIYFFIGLLFGLVYEVSGSLWTPVIFHVAYDFLAILYFRYFFVRLNTTAGTVK